MVNIKANLAFSLCVFMSCLSASICQQYVAYLSMNGIVGEVTFASNGEDTFVAMSFTGNGVENYDTLEIKEFPAVFGQQYSHNKICETLGKTILTMNDISSDEIVKISLSENSLFHKSVVITGGSTRLCATILSAYDSTFTLRAKFFGPIVGDVWFRKQENKQGMYIFSNLAYSVESPHTNTTSLFQLVQFPGGVVDFTNVQQKCQTLFNYNVVIPDLKVGSTVMEDNRQVDFIQQMHGVHVNIGIVLSDKVVACAEVKTVEQKTVRARISWDNVRGLVTMRQSSPFDLTETDVRINGLKFLPVAYHIHMFPVPQRREANDQRCSSENVGGHFNPYGVTDFPDSGTPDQYEVGDLSGKYGKILTETYTANFLDSNLPLFGVNSVIGRSVVIHKSDGSRWVCDNIAYPDDVNTAVALFKSPVYGTMYFRQSNSESDGDTSIYINLSNLNGVSTPAHNFHVHVHPVGKDCASTGPHYNPSQVSTSGNYSAYCSLSHPFRCELGDISGRHQPIKISNTLTSNSGKFYFTDSNLPLSGPHSIIGRSIVVHVAQKGAPRYACANITLLRKTILETSKHWSGDDADGSISGHVNVFRETEFEFSKTRVSLNGHRRQAVDIKIHTLPILPTAQGLNQCQSLRSVFNPFNASSVETPGQTSDVYAVGDLSGKFGKLFLQGFNLRTLDNNLPLSQDIGVTGRPVVVYDKSSNAWKCANLEMVPADKTGHVITAQVLFSSILDGYVRMKQIVYEDGSSSSTSIEVYVNHKNSSLTSSNNWHIHIHPVTAEDKCLEALGHFNPYMVNISSPIYGTRKTEPGSYELGDLSGKHGAYIIGEGRNFYLDDDIPLHTDKTVLGRSLVFHVEAASSRLACANILPLTNLFTFRFSSTVEFDRYRFTATIGKALDIGRLRVVVLHNVDVPLIENGCSAVMVHIAGDVDSNILQGALVGKKMWPYIPTQSCGSHVGPI